MRLIVFVLCCLLPAPAAVADTLAAKLSTKKTLNLAVVKAIVAACEAEALRNGWNVSIAVVDDAGRLAYFQRMDETTNASDDVAIAKALHAANFRRDTKFHEDLLTGGNHIILGVPGMIPLEGGVRLVVDGKVIGAIGVSGVQAPQDAQIARAGAKLLEP